MNSGSLKAIVTGQSSSSSDADQKKALSAVAIGAGLFLRRKITPINYQYLILTNLHENKRNSKILN